MPPRVQVHSGTTGWEEESRRQDTPHGISPRQAPARVLWAGDGTGYSDLTFLLCQMEITKPAGGVLKGPDT